MPLRAKCKHCSWRVESEGSVYLHLSKDAHERGTNHKVKIKGMKK
ncbi:hypothetical protein SEA_ZIMMER_78 [Mycobacterium phage Zimmer]|nr:hypothetical protein SEA_ZIMMER_78 [Mycobacterium phage Zimmer]